MVEGSSPPVRGALQRCTKHTSQFGLIPARAGSTHNDKESNPADRAHPRPCGEHFLTHIVSNAAEGSSPPVRGAHSGFTSSSAAGGLIPARAGSTPQACRPSVGARAHPRPCGEHTPSAHCVEGVLGSSPPVRGAREVDRFRVHPNGLIPARAGSTGGVPGWVRRSGAHPRPCGEHRDLKLLKFMSGGSSPPVRGALHAEVCVVF